MRNRVTLIACTLLFAGAVALYAQDNHPMMTVEDTVKWAKEANLNGGSYLNEPPTPPNPAAREQLWAILADREQEASWKSIVFAYRFLGQSEDVPRIVQWIDGFRNETATQDRVNGIADTGAALGVMAQRKVPGAQAALEKMMSPDYWRPQPGVVGGSLSGKGLVDSAFRLAISAVSSSVELFDPDFKRKVQAIGDALKNPEERKNYMIEVSKGFIEYDAHMADGLSSAQRRGAREAAERAKSRAEEKKHEKPSEGQYQVGRKALGKAIVPLDPAVRDALVHEAREAFAAISADFRKEDREDVLCHMCYRCAPRILADVEPTTRAAELLKDSETYVYLDLQKALVKDLETRHLDESAARFQFGLFDVDKGKTADLAKLAAAPKENVDFFYVQIPYSDVADLNAKHHLLLDDSAGGWSEMTHTDPNWTVTLCILWQAGHWYWVPFGV
jgi:hypothetical protein